ncbi:melanoma inhibitory activity protein 2-like [Leptodactylus fuscus]|uniref:melanoma inhibitory activity protein 2-like n=1 Tax=Leptodactylus fuscus TaxID=238119 RepID=UPI003F4F1D78
MAQLRVYRTLTLVVLLFTTQIHSQKILSDRKKCGDSQCESLMMRVSAKQDYSGPDCRFLTFKTGDEINVYYKLTGRREDLWQGSKGKAYGFFPKDTVTIEEVYRSEEIEIPAQEIDFVCLDGGEYVFENEDSVLHRIDENGEDPIGYTLQEDNSIKGGHPTGEAPDIIPQETPEPEDAAKESWAPSSIAGWFGMGKPNEKKDSETEATAIMKEAINEEAEPQKQPDEAPPQKSGWLGGGIKKFLPFGQQRDEPQVKNEVNGEQVSTTIQQTDQKPINIDKDGEDSKTKWFNFGIRNVLGFGSKNEKKEVSNLNEEAANNDTATENLSQDRALDSDQVPDQSDISKLEKVDRTVDVESNIQVEDVTTTSALDKDGHAKDEFSNVKELHPSNLQHENALTEMNWTEEVGGEYEEKHRVAEAEHSTETLESTQIDDFRKDVAKNTDINEYSDVLSQRTDGHGHEQEIRSAVDKPGKDKIHYLEEVDEPKVQHQDALTEKDKTFQDERREYGKKPRIEAAETTQTSESSEADKTKSIVNIVEVSPNLKAIEDKVEEINKERSIETNGSIENGEIYAKSTLDRHHGFEADLYTQLKRESPWRKYFRTVMPRRQLGLMGTAHSQNLESSS